MIDLRPCLHAQARLRQRSFHSNDHDLIFSLGVHINEQEIFMPEAVAAYEIALRREHIVSLKRRSIPADDASNNDRIAALKREIHQIERITNRKIVVDGYALITSYRPSRREQRRYLLRLRDKASRLRKRW